MKKIFGLTLSILLLAAVSFSFTGCDKKPGGKDEIKIGFSIGDLSNPVWIYMVQQMEKKAKEMGVEFICKDYKQNIATQIDDIENFLTMGCQTIVIHAMDYEAALPLVKEASEKGVKIISYDVNLPGSHGYCGVDNTVVGRAIGTMTGEWINKNLDGKGVVGLFGYPTILAILERENGMKAALAEVSPNSRLVGSVTAGFAEEGVTEAENFMQSNPDINVIMGINDGAILGAYEAFNAAGWGNKKVGLFGCDAVTDALDAINANGIYEGTIFLNVVDAADMMIENGIKMAKGEPYEANMTMKPVLITKENIDQYINVYR